MEELEAFVDVQSSSSSSFSPMMICSSGAFDQEPSGTRVAPTASNSSSLKILTGLRSTLTVYPASSRALAVLGVTGLFSKLRRIDEADGLYGQNGAQEANKCQLC